MQTESNKKPVPNTAILGLGVSGFSCARFLSEQGLPFTAFDQQLDARSRRRFRKLYPQAKLVVGDLQNDDLLRFDRLLVSPGIALESVPIRRAALSGAQVGGDIGLFRRQVKAPIVAITGSNGKSTVTALVGEMARRSGRNVAVGGNIGTPVLDLIADGAQPDLFVLELSSYQLERTTLLAAEVATVLNVTDDHMDRYPNFAAYQAAKHRIFRGCHKLVVNRADRMTRPLACKEASWTSFGEDLPQAGEYGIGHWGGNSYLMFGSQALMPVSKIALGGRHNQQNALAALALGNAVGLRQDAMLAVLREFTGLPHRCQTVATCKGVTFVNDSKGTNVGATIAAIRGLSKAPRDLVLIAGGVGKGADFAPLADYAEHLRAVILLGEAADEIAAVLGRKVRCTRVADMQAAVETAASRARRGNTVVLSPACASFDMFDNYMARGEAFTKAVLALPEVQA